MQNKNKPKTFFDSPKIHASLKKARKSPKALPKGQSGEKKGDEEPLDSEKDKRKKTLLASKSSIFKIIYILQHLKLKAKSRIENKKIFSNQLAKQRSMQPLGKLSSGADIGTKLNNIFELDLLHSNVKNSPEKKKLSPIRLNRESTKEQNLFKKTKKETKHLDFSHKWYILLNKHVEWAQKSKIKAFYKLLTNHIYMENKSQITNLIQSRIQHKMPIIIRGKPGIFKFRLNNKQYLLFPDKKNIKKIEFLLKEQPNYKWHKSSRREIVKTKVAEDPFEGREFLDPEFFVDFSLWSGDRFVMFKIFSLIGENSSKLESRASIEVDYTPFHVKFESDSDSLISGGDETLLFPKVNKLLKKNFYFPIRKKNKKIYRVSHLKKSTHFGIESPDRTVKISEFEIYSYKKRGQRVEWKVRLFVVMDSLCVCIPLPIYDGSPMLGLNKNLSMFEKNIQFLKKFYEEMRGSLKKSIEEPDYSRRIKESNISKMDSFYSFPGSVFNLSTLYLFPRLITLRHHFPFEFALENALHQTGKPKTVD